VIEGVLAEVVTILLGGSILVLVGFIDDQFTPWVRLLTQILAALLLIAWHPHFCHHWYPIDPMLSILLTVLGG